MNTPTSSSAPPGNAPAGGPPKSFTRHLPAIARLLLGLMFVAFSSMVLFNLGPKPPAPPEGTPVALFMGAFVPTGYLTFVKVLELLGGLLVIVPRTSNLGLLVLGPIMVNILAFHAFVMKGEGLFSPVIVVLCVLALFLLWAERKAFAGLVTRTVETKN